MYLLEKSQVQKLNQKWHGTTQDIMPLTHTISNFNNLQTYGNFLPNVLDVLFPGAGLG